MEYHSEKYNCEISEEHKARLSEIKEQLETEIKVESTVEKLKPENAEDIYNKTLPGLSVLRSKCVADKNAEIFSLVCDRMSKIIETNFDKLENKESIIKCIGKAKEVVADEIKGNNNNSPLNQDNIINSKVIENKIKAEKDQTK